MVLYSFFIMFKFTHLGYDTVLQYSQEVAALRQKLPHYAIKRLISYVTALEIYDVRT
jgi:uncharacterized protein with GYD domain